MWFNNDEAEKNMEYFSRDWMESWSGSIQDSDKYKKAGKNWNASILIKIDPAPKPFEKENSMGIYLHLSYGECKEMRYAVENDIDQTDLILSANETTWIEMVERSKDPTMAILRGDIKVEKGSLITLSTQRKAASALLKTAPSIHEGIPLVKKKISTLPDQKNSIHQKFVTTSRGLNFESFPMELFQEAKQVGIWDPSEIDLTKDEEQWQAFSNEEKRIISHLTGLFLAGKEAATLNLLPLIQVIAKEGRIEEEIFLTSFLWEEAKHTEFFSGYAQTVLVDGSDFEKFHKPMFKTLLNKKLPTALQNLSADDSPAVQLKAAGIYNLTVEGILVETGFEVFSKILNENNLLPGIHEGILKIKQDETRHIAYGLHLINRLLHENPKLSEDFENQLEELLYDSTNIMQEIFAQYEIVPFGLKKDWFLDYAIKRFQDLETKLNL